MDYYISLLSDMEVFLLTFCPIAGMVGGFVHMLLLDFDWTTVPKLEFIEKPKNQRIKLTIAPLSSRLRGGWYLARILLGLVAGMIVFLFVHGSLTETASAASKVLIIAFFAGLTAPSLFKELDEKYRSKFAKELGE